MPRETYVIHNFSGGLVDDPEKTDLAQNELSRADDIDVSREGLISILGELSSTDSTTKITEVLTFPAGRGLFKFKSDYSASDVYSPTGYYVYGGNDGNDHNVMIVSSSGITITPSSGGNKVTLISNTEEFQPAFYAVDGVLRVCDANFNSTSVDRYWIGYIDRVHFSGVSGSSLLHQGWYFKENSLPAPSSGLVAKRTSQNTSVIKFVAEDTNVSTNSLIAIDDGISALYGGDYGGFEQGTLDSALVGMYALSTALGEFLAIETVNATSSISTTTLTAGTWADKLVRVFPAAGGLNIDVQVLASTIIDNGSWISATYVFGVSYVYDGEQESKLTRLAGFVEATTGTAPYSFDLDLNITTPFNPRITAMRLYAAENTAGVESQTIPSGGTPLQWYHVLDIDIEGGGISIDKGAGLYKYFTCVSSSALIQLNKIDNFDVFSLSVESYEGNSGIVNANEDIDPRWKTAVIANRRAYIGNVRINGKNLGDTILKSQVNRFDVFQEVDKLDVAINDGEEIVHLEEFADRILQFKNNTLYIINISQNVEFLESKHEWLGVGSPAHVIRTENGVVWANERGVYLYNGRELRDLMLDPSDPSRRRISLSNWRSFWSNGNVVGYDARDKRIVIVGSTDIYTIDLYDLSWVKGINKGRTNTKSNSITDFDGYMKYMYSRSPSDPLVEMWYETPISATSHVYIEKETHFNLPGIKKVFHGMYLTHTGGGGKASIYYTKDGDTKLYSMTPATLPSASSRVVNEYKPANSTDARNFSTLGIVIKSSSQTSNTLTISDMTLIFRRKGAR